MELRTPSPMMAQCMASTVIWLPKGDICTLTILFKLNYTHVQSSPVELHLTWIWQELMHQSARWTLAGPDGYDNRLLSICIAPCIHLFIIPWALARWCSLHSWLSVSNPEFAILCLPAESVNVFLGVFHQSSIRQIWPNRFNFLSKMIPMMFFVVPALDLTSLFVTFCCHRIWS